MKGRTMVFLIIFVCILSVILVYFWLQNFITKHDIDKALAFTNTKISFDYRQLYKIS